MSFNFTTFYTRFGHVGYLLNSINSFFGSANLSAAGIESVGSGIDEIAGSYATPDLNLIGGLYNARDSYRSVSTTMLTYLQSLAQSTLIQMANDASPQPNQTLSNAVAYLVAQMQASSQTVNKPTASATSTAGTNNGTGVMPVTVLGANGLQQDYVLAESITATCTADSQSGATAGQEQFTFISPAAESNPLLWDYPLGSAISVTANAVDALQNNSGGNLLQNGAFATWSTPSSGPDNWLILVAGTGGVGTDIIQATGSNVYKGTTGIAFVGDGSSLPSISQPFAATPSTAGNAGGTSATITPLNQYCVNLYLKLNVVPAAGVLTVDLTDGNNTTVNDAQGNPNSVAIALTGATTSFVAHNVFFRTPAVLPTTGLRLRIRLSTALSAASTVYFGHVAMQDAPQLYSGGPFVAPFSGNPNFFKPDYFSLTIANDYASKFQLLADRIFNMRNLGYQLPSSGSPTISDSLVS